MDAGCDDPILLACYGWSMLPEGEEEKISSVPRVEKIRAGDYPMETEYRLTLSLSCRLYFQLKPNEHPDEELNDLMNRTLKLFSKLIANPGVKRRRAGGVDDEYHPTNGKGDAVPGPDLAGARGSEKCPTWIHGYSTW
ncbi:MAG: hypothetical protein U1D30_11095 [Planctomycetota bacterium]